MHTVARAIQTTPSPPPDLHLSLERAGVSPGVGQRHWRDGKPPLPRELDQMGQLMVLCLHASTRAWKRVIHGRQSAGDVRAVAITLFLECSRKGVTPEELLHDIAA